MSQLASARLDLARILLTKCASAGDEGAVAITRLLQTLVYSTLITLTATQLHVYNLDSSTDESTLSNRSYS